MKGRTANFYRMLDQVCIFLFMASCFTPFALAHLRTPLGMAILALMWILAIAGAFIRVRGRSQTLPIAIFLPLGWLPVLTLDQIFAVGNWSGLLLVLAGGLSYTGGFWSSRMIIAAPGITRPGTSARLLALACITSFCCRLWPCPDRFWPAAVRNRRNLSFFLSILRVFITPEQLLHISTHNRVTSAGLVVVTPFLQGRPIPSVS